MSLYEKHNPALFVHNDILSSQDRAIPETALVSRGELGHVHPDVCREICLNVHCWVGTYCLVI